MRAYKADEASERHSREGGNPGSSRTSWTPAFAGVTLGGRCCHRKHPKIHTNPPKLPPMRYGEGIIDALAAAFKARGIGGLGRSNLKNYRQIALTWPTLGIRQTLAGESGAPGQTWQTLSAESVPALTTGREDL
jgi:hypothetical protein